MLISVVSHGQVQEQSKLIIPWWSFTKTVLAATALSLVRDDLIGLDVPIFDQPFTLRQLLRHEAGLADYGELAEYHSAVKNNELPWSADEMMKRLDGARLRYTPGNGWCYSNVGYMLIGQLIERLTNLSLDDAVSQRVLTPLGISNVRFAKTPQDLPPLHINQTSNYDPAWVFHGLLIGPVSQASLFLDRLFSENLLTDGLLQEMQAARKLGGPIPGRPWLATSYGLGVMQGRIDGGLSICGHTGCGPESVIAVYRICNANISVCCAAFETGISEGGIESFVVKQLKQVLQNEAKGF